MKFHNHLASFSSRRFCWMVRGKLAASIDGALTRDENSAVADHLRKCTACSEKYDELVHTRRMLRTLRPVTPPAGLGMKLRVMASRERARKISGNPWFDFEPLILRLKNLMQPLAIPFAGGTVSALVLFSMLVPTYPAMNPRQQRQDVPTALFTGPDLKNVAPFTITGEELIVELVIDEQGKVIDYSLPKGPANAALRRKLENSLLFTTFTPAMAFGQPIAGRIRLSFPNLRPPGTPPSQRLLVEVKG